MSTLNPCGGYAELATASNFSFLRGASHPKDLVLTAIQRGHAGLGLADRNTVAGVVRAWSALKEIRVEGLAPRTGCAMAAVPARSPSSRTR